MYSTFNLRILDDEQKCHTMILAQVLEDVDGVTMEDEKIEDEAISSLDVGSVDDETPSPLEATASTATKTIPPPGTGQKIYEIDPLLKGFRDHLDYR